MNNFEGTYTKLINSIKGNKENTLEFDTFDNSWEFQACNPSGCCVSLGEVEGLIQAEGKTLEELLINIEIAINLYNSKVGEK